MKNLENVKEILMHKKSTTMAQDIFMNDLNDIYFELDKKERDFLEKSIDQIFRKYYYSAVEPETYITPANILSSLAEKESAGNTVFVPKVELIKKKDVLTKIKSSLHYVNSENHYMVTDFETVLEICKESLKVNIIGAPEDSERKRFEDRLFLNDRHYLNIIVLVAIKLGYIQLVKQGKKNMAITTEKSKELLGMSMKDKIKIPAKGIVENYVSSSVLEIPELKDIITNNAIWEIIKNPIKFEDFMYSVNEKVGLDTDIFNKIIHDKELEYEQLEDMDANNPYSYMLAMFLIHIDVYLFTPLGYYLQLIKPFYGNVYNIAIEVGEIIAVLSGNYEHVRNMLFFVPEKFDLTLFGEEILLDGGKSERRQEIPEKYSDNSFLKCFEIREQFINEELLNLIDNYGGFDEDDDDDEDYDDNSLDEDYDDEDDDDEDYNDEDYDNDDYEDDDYDRDYEKEGFTKSEHKYDNIIDLSNYKKEDSSIERNYRKR
ncbi:MAG TPA: hypothetical protein PK733_07310, partial [Clostridiales bacterium]|nr:hypothetical protein [Clostridiales bacterium]